MSEEKNNYAVQRTVIPLSSICILTQIVFLILKLTGAVDWKWLHVCIPAIVLASFIGVIIVLFMIVTIIAIIAAVCCSKEEDDIFGRWDE